MKHSEFWWSVRQVYGDVYGTSLVEDLYLDQLQATAAEALEAGRAAQEVWKALVEATGKSESQWVYRAPRRPRQ